MSRIKVTNTAIIIENYNLGECNQLEHMFNIWDPNYHKFFPCGRYYDEENKRLYIHGGNKLWKIKNLLGERYYDRISSHPYIKVPTIKMKHGPKNETQIEALQFMCDIDKYAELENVPFRQLALNTGKGKTYTSLATIAFYSIKAIVITGSTTLLAQWKEEVFNHTYLTENDVLNISGSAMCNAIVKQSTTRYNNASIYLCSHGTLRSFGDTFGWDQVYKLFETLGIGIKIFDEAHTNFDNMFMIDFFTNCWRSYYVTATPGRSDRKQDFIYKTSFSEVPKIDLFDEENDPHTAYYSLEFFSNPSIHQRDFCKSTKYGLDRMRYMDYLTKKPELYQVLTVIFNNWIRHLSHKDRVLIYIGTNKGILRVYYWIMMNYPEYIGEVGVYTSLLDHDNKLKEKSKRILLSTSKSAGLGEHLENLKLSIVLAEPFKSPIVARQTLGRTRNPNTFYIDVIDLSFKQTRNFYNAKKPVFAKYADGMYNIDLRGEILNKEYENVISERDIWQKQVLHFDHDSRFPDLDKLLPENIIDIPDRNQSAPRCPIRFVKNKGKLLD